ncbi:hypothetical protein ACP70R_036971 [Stipagrostis hirtigluma subsp. patula]
MKLCAVLFLVLLVSTIVSPCATTRARASRAAPATCDLLALRPCAPAVIWGAAPSASCCAKLREQRRCLCRYSKNPSLSGYINSHDGKRLAVACRFRAPRC